MHSCVSVYVHVIFSTKNRKALIPNCVENKLYSYLGGIAKSRKVISIKINGVEDHVHLLLKFDPTVSISVLVKELKSHSTSWMKRQGEEDFRWQEGYGAFSCSPSVIESVINYIANQKEHHKTTSFLDEMKAFAARLNIAWQMD